MKIYFFNPPIKPFLANFKNDNLENRNSLLNFPLRPVKIQRFTTPVLKLLDEKVVNFNSQFHRIIFDTLLLQTILFKIIRLFSIFELKILLFLSF